jgi:signal transduction histidine kinase
MRLVAKLTLVFLVAVMLLTGVSSYVTVQRAFDRFESQHHKDAQARANRLTQEALQAHQRSGEEGVEQFFEYVEALDGGVRWWRLQRRAYLGTAPQIPAADLERLLSGNMFTTITRDEYGRRYLHTYCPISLGDERDGALEFTASLQEIDERTKETIVFSLLMIGGMALLGTMLVLVVGVRWVARPLDRLIEKTERIGRGDFGGPLPVNGTDELNRLSAAVNSMCQQLSQQQETIRTQTSERIAALEQLRHADRLKTVGRLAAGIAHEMGTPLNVISGRAELIAGNKLDEAGVLDSAAAIKTEADRMTKIIRQLLDFARRRTPHRAVVDLRNVVQDAVNLLHTLAEKKSVDLQMFGGDDCSAYIDAGQIQQVITNLAINSIQSMPEGGAVSIRLETREQTPPGQPMADPTCYRAVIVEDEGVGIPAEDLDQVFVPFFTTKDVGEGTGLGLSIAFGIVQEHGGWIDVESKVGRGSRFTVYLPCH